ncbi:uncharacterized protein LOC114788240 [Denticeps clupeoides]|uniref:uncharacterized protein LOC114788240 n=1 Tax=Denticeps clupeoides TaxID=299321 RepID=UPI0010A4EA38|nr:uncharacterized protein LOC114788240 [Denticeps clupeoides]XP_028832434.1 uncharacterized protein LOC114788240 [Denticeps clupeoides]XP_028832436.1 uncharacterized protein LOC114788240 [Denticeps clupeoides]XP_028832437.1 uncharacterized protein LOC114788240 [Denticeps clupeoides]XP_028832438.1 uncharacterized protein LOC114788240 [Denticeps clupeoides]XP_028832439.1 uncharacterized protein LOC114788240 [Denticeps clupeoides]
MFCMLWSNGCQSTRKPILRQRPVTTAARPACMKGLPSNIRAPPEPIRQDELSTTRSCLSHQKFTTYSKQFTHMGNITETTRLEKIAESCKKSLEMVKQYQARGLDPPKHQFESRTYNTVRSTNDAISHTIHTTLAHLDNKNCYARLFVDFSSAFNTVIPSKLIQKLRALGLSATLCNWVLDFLTNRRQHVRIGKNTSTTMILNTGTPQGSEPNAVLPVYTRLCV